MDKTKIMIVEDESIVARDIRNMVIGLGYDATNVTSTADEAIKIAESERPHLVLMDIMLSGKTTGVEARSMKSRKTEESSTTRMS
ncbi:response regulator [Acidobacteriota bacterium]